MSCHQRTCSLYSCYVFQPKAQSVSPTSSCLWQSLDFRFCPLALGSCQMLLQYLSFSAISCRISLHGKVVSNIWPLLFLSPISWCDNFYCLVKYQMISCKIKKYILCSVREVDPITGSKKAYSTLEITLCDRVYLSFTSEITYIQKDLNKLEF